jgi:hypothetical protein
MKTPLLSSWAVAIQVHLPYKLSTIFFKRFRSTLQGWLFYLKHMGMQPKKTSYTLWEQDQFLEKIFEN